MAVANQLNGTIMNPHGAKLTIGAVHDPGFFDGFNQFATLMHGQAQRLFATDMFFGFSGHNAHRYVPMVGGRNHDCVNIFPVQNLPKIKVSRAAFVVAGGRVFCVMGIHPFAGFFHAPRIHVANGHHLCIGQGEQAGYVGNVGPLKILTKPLPPGANHCHGDAVRRCRYAVAVFAERSPAQYRSRNNGWKTNGSDGYGAVFDEVPAIHIKG